jgi:hypothetical protein
MQVLINRQDLQSAIAAYPEIAVATDKAAMCLDLLLSVENEGKVYQAVQTGDATEMYNALMRFQRDFQAAYAQEGTKVVIKGAVYDILIEFLTEE